MAGKEFISLLGLLREIRDHFPSNPPRFGFICLQDFGCCSCISRFRIPDALRLVIMTSGLHPVVELNHVNNTRECAILILRVAKALCRKDEPHSTEELHCAIYYTVSIFHHAMSPAPGSEAQNQLTGVSYEKFLEVFEPHRILGFKRKTV